MPDYQIFQIIMKKSIKLKKHKTSCYQFLIRQISLLVLSVQIFASCEIQRYIAVLETNTGFSDFPDYQIPDKRKSMETSLEHKVDGAVSLY